MAKRKFNIAFETQLASLFCQHDDIVGKVSDGFVFIEGANSVKVEDAIRECFDIKSLKNFKRKLGRSGFHKKIGTQTWISEGWDERMRGRVGGRFQNSLQISKLDSTTSKHQLHAVIQILHERVQRLENLEKMRREEIAVEEGTSICAPVEQCDEESIPFDSFFQNC
jgi:hypothetical protein